MSTAEVYFHETWLGMVQPIEGLVVSLPVLVEAQCMERQPPATGQKLLELLAPLAPLAGDPGAPAPTGLATASQASLDDENGIEVTLAIQDLNELLEGLLELTPDLFDSGDALPEDLALYVHEGGQTLRPTLGLRKLDAPADSPSETTGVSNTGPTDDSTPASRAGSRYEALLWDLPAGLHLDKPETQTGPWEYPPSAKMDRLLRHCRVPIGILTNRTHVRLIYAPHGESSGWITFRMTDMATVGGRPILDAFVMLLSATRFFGVSEDRSLPALLTESRKRQANVTNELADQVFEALLVLLRGFEAAAERDGRHLLNDALARQEAEDAGPDDQDHLYQGLLTALLRLVFVLYAEDRGLLPVEHPLYDSSLSAQKLFETLQEDHGAHPDSMSRRFGAWSRLIALFRAIYLGVDHGHPEKGGLSMPPRRGHLFDPQRFPFLEGWGPTGGAPITQAEDRAAVHVPTLDDLTVFQVLEKLLIFQGQRLSYRTLDVEQIGSVYEALMGYHVIRVPAPAVCLRPNRVWVTTEELLALPPSQRAKWLKDTVGLPKAQADSIAKAAGQSEKTGDPATHVYEALAEHSIAGRGANKDRSLALAQPGRLVVQPGEERRRTSSHYTPRSLSAPIVARTLEPLLATMGPTPSSDLLLDLKVCDPAMGSGAFLVEACRYLADHLVAAWTREGKLDPHNDQLAPSHDQLATHNGQLPPSHDQLATHNGQLPPSMGQSDPLMRARRLVAQRCLYGVDKNPSAVTLAKLSLWLVTLARDLPFTFLDHSLRHGDSLVGLSFDQIQAFHFAPNPKKPGQQLELCQNELRDALDEAIALRQQIVDLAHKTGPIVQREKERLLFDAEDALARVRLIADLIVGAFFSETTDKARDKERQRRLDMVLAWLADGGPPPEHLRELQAALRQHLPPFHWMLEYPEIFYLERPDPLEQGKVNRAAFMDAFLGNPPFAGKNGITATGGPSYLDWLLQLHSGSHGNADLSAHFFRRAHALLGDHGTIGLIATNTIAQGDTRTTALLPLVQAGYVIYDAIRSMPWPGTAAVTVSVVHLALGTPAQATPTTSYRLDGQRAPTINSRLRPVPERKDPTVLAANASLSFQGSIVLGMGFTLTPAERDALVQKDPKNAQRIFPYLGGKEVNTNPDQGFDRHVINFGQMTLEEAAQWPDLLNIVREKVKPERDRSSHAQADWWHFERPRHELYDAIQGLQRCLVTARVTKHLCFSFQPTDRILNEKLYVFPFETYGAFAILQSRIHAPWAWLLSSTMKTDLNYSATDCFETFPFPKPDPRAVIPELEEAGAHLYNARYLYMRNPDNSVGLTTTYNRLKDPTCQAPPILHLRRLHEDLDHAVLAAYNWQDLQVPPYCPHTDAHHQALESFQDQIIDRLFVLNAKRAEDERLKGPTTKSTRTKGGKSGKTKTVGRAKQNQPSKQPDLFGEGGDQE